MQGVQTNISSKISNDYVIESSKTITSALIKKHITFDSSIWNGKMTYWSFTKFSTSIINNDSNINWFIDKLNEIASISPSFDLVDFLTKEINDLQNDPSIENDADYFKVFKANLEKSFNNYKLLNNLKQKTTDILINKSENMFLEFGLKIQKNPFLNNLKNNIINRNSVDIKWKFIQGIFKNIINSLENNALSSYQIAGIPGFYKKDIWDANFNKIFSNLGLYNYKTADVFADIVIENILNNYRDNLANLKPGPIYEYRDIFETLERNSMKLNDLDKLNNLIPGSKAIIEKIQKHQNGKEYGTFKLSYSPKLDDKSIEKIFINLNWLHNNKSYKLINSLKLDIKNTISNVQLASKEFNKWYKNSYNQIDDSRNYYFNDLANALNVPVKDFLKNNTGDMSVTQFVKFIKNSGNDYDDFGKKIQDIATKIPNLEFKVTYEIKSLQDYSLSLKLKILDKTILKPDPNNFDQVVLINLTKYGNKSIFPLPKIDLKFLFQNIFEILSNPLQINQQDFKNFNLLNTKNVINKSYFENTLEGRKIKQILDEKYKTGLKASDIVINNYVTKLPNNKYTLHLSIHDKRFDNNKVGFSSFKTIENNIRVISIEDQLDKLNLIKLLYEYSGKPNSKFDSKNLKKSLNGPIISIQDINSGLKLNNLNHWSIKNSSSKFIIDRINDILNKYNQVNPDSKIHLNIPNVINWITDKYDNSGHGLIWEYQLDGRDAFGNNNPIYSNSNKYNVVYEFVRATQQEKIDSIKKIKNYGTNVIRSLNKSKLVTAYKKNLVKEAIQKINMLINNYENDINNNSLGWSKHFLKQHEKKVLNEINVIFSMMKKVISPNAIVKKVSEVLKRSLSKDEGEQILEFPELFAKLLDEKSSKKVFEEILKNKEVASKLSNIINKPIFFDFIKGMVYVEKNYHYTYLGAGIASGVAGLVSGGAFISALKANKRLKKIKGKAANIRGSKLILMITAFVTIGSIGASVVTILWFFISKGGV